MDHQELLPHLFRTEYRKIVSVLAKRLGLKHLEVAEDIASDTFFVAAQTWGISGLPQNPVAWLYNVARNKAFNYLQRQSILKEKVVPELQNHFSDTIEEDIDLSPQNIADSQLKMMFAICHPSISPESQVGLALRILCGFGIDEIADAFLTNKETINKRLFRAKEKLREEKIRPELPETHEIELRLENVLTTLYLLFNEGYYSSSSNQILRKDFCLEAMRLCEQLTTLDITNKPQVNALLALMCFHASRFEARVDRNGELILYEDQDTSLWNQELIQQGAYYIHKSADGNIISKYHLEASIAWWHTQNADTQEKWENILQLYNQLLQLEYSPVAALNRTYALAKANGKQEAITEAEKLKLTGNQFYYMLLGELYKDIDNSKALDNFNKALEIAKNHSERKVIQKKIENL